MRSLSRLELKRFGICKSQRRSVRDMAHWDPFGVHRLPTGRVGTDGATIRTHPDGLPGYPYSHRVVFILKGFSYIKNK